MKISDNFKLIQNCDKSKYTLQFLHIEDLNNFFNFQPEETSNISTVPIKLLYPYEFIKAFSYPVAGAHWRKLIQSNKIKSISIIPVQIPINKHDLNKLTQEIQSYKEISEQTENKDFISIPCALLFIDEHIQTSVVMTDETDTFSVPYIDLYESYVLDPRRYKFKSLSSDIATTSLNKYISINCWNAFGINQVKNYLLSSNSLFLVDDNLCTINDLDITLFNNLHPKYFLIAKEQQYYLAEVVASIINAYNKNCQYSKYSTLPSQFDEKQQLERIVAQSPIVPTLEEQMNSLDAQNDKHIVERIKIRKDFDDAINRIIPWIVFKTNNLQDKYDYLANQTDSMEGMEGAIFFTFLQNCSNLKKIINEQILKFDSRMNIPWIYNLSKNDLVFFAKVISFFENYSNNANNENIISEYFPLRATLIDYTLKQKGVSFVIALALSQVMTQYIDDMVQKLKDSEAKIRLEKKEAEAELRMQEAMNASLAHEINNKLENAYRGLEQLASVDITETAKIRKIMRFIRPISARTHLIRYAYSNDKILSGEKVTVSLADIVIGALHEAMEDVMSNLASLPRKNYTSSGCDKAAIINNEIAYRDFSFTSSYFNFMFELPIDLKELSTNSDYVEVLCLLLHEYLLNAVKNSSFLPRDKRDIRVEIEKEDSKLKVAIQNTFNVEKKEETFFSNHGLSLTRRLLSKVGDVTFTPSENLYIVNFSIELPENEETA